jgi:hypothetical protein
MNDTSNEAVQQALENIAAGIAVDFGSLSNDQAAGLLREMATQATTVLRDLEEGLKEASVMQPIERAALVTVIDYVSTDGAEEKEWEAEGCPEDGIWPAIRTVRDWLQRTEPETASGVTT